MKIIHSYWSKPSHSKNGILAENRYNGGWLALKYHYMSWALSCLKFKEFYEDVELYTDQEGKELLIDLLNLPSSKVHISLDELNYLPEQMWALPKIFTYSLQTEPFIHADGDVYIWRKFDNHFEQSPLIAQHLENSFAYYKEALDIEVILTFSVC